MADKIVASKQDGGVMFRYRDIGDGTHSLPVAQISAPGAAGYPSGATPLHVASGNVANAVATATFTAVAGKTNYVTGFEKVCGSQR